ncbi:ATP-dependent protease LonB [Laceyella sacchari]|jgi:ATP-dependent Lon protease|uniref:endopeptidase La n=1 Tax=Laceyella sacchari TaxID=37482 RepID=A0ABY5U9A2_LACSH|nr:ATP-dependent protease LonB [Laceyella sacchari]TCW41044.1 Lon-like ATP-dependent protease [Laceyella sacchari]UWE04638.1 ATP-dependent protease LonB [Laceyella sacchari]
MSWTALLMFLQVFFSIVIGLYFWNLLKSQQTHRSAVDREAKRELEKLQSMRKISLTEPLAEKTRPSELSEIIGQEEGIRALKAAMCGPNPQHVIIYGPPGVGKTAAARIILKEAIKNSASPFTRDAKFVEIDATTARFDERGIADPLIGSVHDPIYQGAGAMGVAGVPQPKPGAVTKAHGGVLFIDEIGELHPVQMNKLLKVLEDRKVFFESAYYSSEDSNTPSHIHDIFQNGMPADFRLIGATTRTPAEIPPAIRSRCMEIFFRPLLAHEIEQVAEQALKRINFDYEPEAVQVITRYATNGRDAVNIVQTAVGLVLSENRRVVEARDVEWVVHSSQLNPRPEQKMPVAPQVGLVTGLAVYGPHLGTVIEIEVTATPAESGKGCIQITGVVEEEEMAGRERTIRRKSMARGSVENVITVLRQSTNLNPDAYHLHINFPGGMPLDGPSAGVAIATAIYSAIKRKPVDHRLAMTGELSIHGYVKPVGGIIAKVDAAKQAGATRVLIPRENMQSIFEHMEGIEVIPVERIEAVLDLALVEEEKQTEDATVPSVFAPTSAPV